MLDADAGEPLEGSIISEGPPSASVSPSLMLPVAWHLDKQIRRERYDRPALLVAR